MKHPAMLFACIMSCVVIAATTGASLISLGSAESFAVLGSTTVTSSGQTALFGDLGVYSGTAITGFYGTTTNDGPGTFIGTSHEGDAVAGQAQADALTAYNALTTLVSTQDLTGQDLGGLTLSPGVYNFDTTSQLTGTLTLDGVGDYVFNIGSTLTTAESASISFINGADPVNDVFWRVGTSTTLGAGTMFGGTIIADQSNTLNTGARVDGRVIALKGAVTLDTNFIAVPEPSTLFLMGLGGLVLLIRRRCIA